MSRGRSRGRKEREGLGAPLIISMGRILKQRCQKEMTKDVALYLDQTPSWLLGGILRRKVMIWYMSTTSMGSLVKPDLKSGPQAKPTVFILWANWL